MALINCPECKAEVSDTALTCTKCGIQLRKLKRTLFGKIIKWLFIIFNSYMLIWLLYVLIGVAIIFDNKIGAAIGSGIGIMVIGTYWIIGDIILGILVLFTRPKP